MLWEKLIYNQCSLKGTVCSKILFKQAPLFLNALLFICQDVFDVRSFRSFGRYEYNHELMDKSFNYSLTMLAIKPE